MNPEIIYAAIIALLFVAFLMRYPLLGHVKNSHKRGMLSFKHSESIIDLVIKADQQDPSAIERLAERYRHGDGVPQCSTHARLLIQKAKNIRKQNTEFDFADTVGMR